MKLEAAGFATSERRGLEGLVSLRDDWIRLAASTGHYFHQFDWFVEFARADDHPVADLVFVVVAAADGRVVGIVPLEQRIERIRRLPCRIWATVGSRCGDVMMLASGSDILCESPRMARPVLDATLRFLADRRPTNTLLLVGRMTREAIALEACMQLPRKFHYKRGAVDWVDTDRRYSELYAGLSRKFRASLRNTANRAAAEGVVEFRWSAADAEDFSAACADFKKVEASGWKGTVQKGGALATAQSSLQREFVEGLFTPAAGCRPFVHRLLLDGRCIAALLGVHGRQAVAVLKIGYDESFDASAPATCCSKTCSSAAARRRKYARSTWSRTRNGWHPGRRPWSRITGSTSQSGRSRPCCRWPCSSCRVATSNPGGPPRSLSRNLTGLTPVPRGRLRTHCFI
jgi:hypothetical protein